MEKYQKKMSKLSEFEDEIWGAWENGCTYREILENLSAEHGIHASTSTLHSFIQVRLKRRKPRRRPVQVEKQDITNLKKKGGSAKAFDFSKFIRSEKQETITPEKKFKFNPEDPIK